MCSSPAFRLTKESFSFTGSPRIVRSMLTLSMYGAIVAYSWIDLMGEGSSDIADIGQN